VNFRYPIFLDLMGKKCVVTGEGVEIAAKVRALVEASAQVVYVNPAAEPRIANLAESGAVNWQRRKFEPQDLDDCFLIISDLEDNSEVFALAEARNVLCNSVDDPEHCRFSFGSIHRQGDLTIAISTNGRAPALAVRLREWLEREIGPEYGVLLEMMKRIRPEVNADLLDFEKRRQLWYRIVDSDVLTLLRDGRPAEADACVRTMVEEALSNTSHFRTSFDNGCP